MIYFAGVVNAVADMDGRQASFKAGGFLFDTAARVRREVDPRVSVLAKLSNDGPGRVVLEDLVKEKLMFDPALVSPYLPSRIIIRDGASRDVELSSGSAAVSATSEEHMLSLGENSDVDFLVVTAEGLYLQPLFSSILDAATFVTPRPRLVLDVGSAYYRHDDDARLRRQVLQAAAHADAIILEDEDIALLGGDCDWKQLCPHVACCHGDVLELWDADGHKSLEGGRLRAYSLMGSLF